MSRSPRVLVSGRPRPGRRFEPIHETALNADALKAVLGLPGAHRGLVVVREMAGPFGVPDLVAAIGPRGLLRSRQALGVPPLLNQVDAGIASVAAARAPRTAATFAKRTGWALETVERRIPRLLRSGALQSAGRHSYVRPAALRPVGRIYAIETKVKDWRRAMRQARTYALWCDSYVVVMGSLGAGSLPAVVDAISRDRGGLMVDGKWLQRPRGAGRAPAQRLWGSEHLVAALV